MVVCEDPTNIPGDEPIAKHLQRHCFTAQQHPNLVNKQMELKSTQMWFQILGLPHITTLLLLHIIKAGMRSFYYHIISLA